MIWDFFEKIMSSLETFFYNCKYFFLNIKTYFSILKKDRWWDYYFFEDLVIFKLKDLEKHWGKDTHYKGDCFTKKRIQVLLREWERIQEFDVDNPLDEKTEKMKEEWFRKLGRLMPRLWD